jgi:(p)ppGpp synthase/HD superfamily hydrolase
MLDEKKMLEVAIQIAGRAHEGQVDKNGEPYILHAIAVMMRVQGGYLEKTVAVLHDVIEDTDVTLSELSQRGFPDDAIYALGVLTKPKGGVYMEYIAKIAQNPIARAVKLADLEHNMVLDRMPKPISDKDQERWAKYRVAYAFLKGV